MSQRPEVEQSGSIEKEPIQQGIKINFSNPGVLRAFILNPEMLRRTSTLAERMSGIREFPLGDFPLDGDLFESANFTLVVEPDRAPRTEVGRPTVIIRADIRLGKKDSKLKRLQLGRIAPKVTPQKPEDIEMEDSDGVLTSLYVDEEQHVAVVQYSRNTFRIEADITHEKESSEKRPLVVLQIWDKDAGYGSISVSLVSWDKYSLIWHALHDLDEQKRKIGLEVDHDNADRWNFFGPVGIDVHDPERFNEAIEFYQKAFSIAIRSLYQAEDVNVPNLLCEIEPPMILGDQKVITFEDIGGQSGAVYYLRQFANLEKTGKTVVIPGTKRAVLLAGSPGNGKTTLVEAFANDLGAPLLKKTTRDLVATGGDIVKLVESSLLEAKAAASRTNNKAVLCFEQLEALLGQNPIAHDYFLNTMDRWSSDPQVVLIATSNSPDLLHEGIVSRFAQVPILPPNERGIKEILAIQVEKIAQALGNDVFADVDLGRLARRLAVIKDLSGRDIVQFLSSSYLLTRGGKLSMLNTETLLQMIPDRRIGFKPS